MAKVLNGAEMKAWLDGFFAEHEEELGRLPPAESLAWKDAVSELVEAVCTAPPELLQAWLDEVARFADAFAPVSLDSQAEYGDCLAEGQDT